MGAYQGDTPFRIGDKDVTFRVDFAAVDALVTEMGDKNWGAQIGAAFDEYDMDKVVRIVQIMTRCHHDDEFTAEAIKEASPPFIPLYQACEVAVNLFLYGHPNELENIATESSASVEEAGADDPLSTPKTRWRDRGASLLRQVFARRSFG